MAAYNKFDERLESLIVETRTHWGGELSDVPPGERTRIATHLHCHPAQASHVHYERVPTGFCRQITVTREDVTRIESDAAAAE